MITGVHDLACSAMHPAFHSSVALSPEGLAIALALAKGHYAWQAVHYTAPQIHITTSKAHACRTQMCSYAFHEGIIYCACSKITTLQHYYLSVIVFIIQYNLRRISLGSPGWSQTIPSSCFSLSSAGTTGLFQRCVLFLRSHINTVLIHAPY